MALDKTPFEILETEILGGIDRLFHAINCKAVQEDGHSFLIYRSAEQVAEHLKSILPNYIDAQLALNGHKDEYQPDIIKD